ncbi:AzlD domain-containing protein [Halogranum rubrum]|uniref:Branched-chain amino acid transport n=1 Tax=Halogranum salarium B-1 TaxID=1210908 RepID=J3JEN2_9EURY|nr:AzlD domain-containing protein [Halogranum salarium]EJN58509.1 hypothetical protein HSB1_29870 [Halogranum salarium B-1]
MTTAYGPLSIWMVIVAIGVITYAIRLSFIALFGHIDDIPPRVEQALTYVPAAVLAALVAPALVSIQPTLVGTLTADRLLAGLVAAAVAWRTENVFATIAVGMGTLWLLRFVVPLVG